MSLASWAEGGWLHRHETSVNEIAELLAVADRGLADARVDGLTPDARVTLAYPVVLAIGAAALAAVGYRAGKDRHHERVIDSLWHTMGMDQTVVARLHRYRRLRNEMTYERVGKVGEQDADAFLSLVQDLRERMLVWLTETRPDLMS